jgi:hypothetical protein
MKPRTSPKCEDVYECLKKALIANLEVNSKLSDLLLGIEYGAVSKEEIALYLKDLEPDLYKLVRYVLDAIKLLNTVHNVEP